MTRRRILPFYVSPRPCAAGCIFCSPTAGRPVDESRIVTPERVHREVESHLQTLAPGERVELAFYGDIFDAPDWTGLLEAASEWSRADAVTGLRVMCRPDQLSEQVASSLVGYRVDCVELDVPSLADNVLASLPTTHSPQLAGAAVAWLHAAGIKVGLQLRPGLPGSHMNQEMQTVERAIALHPAFVRLCPTLILKGTWLEKLYQQGRYVPLTVDEAVGICRALVERLEAAEIPVTRIGLQPVRDLHLEPGCVVGGPYHPSLRTLIEAERLHDEAAELLSNRLVAGRHVTLLVASAAESNLRGPENCNLARLQKRFRCASVNVRVDPTLPRELLRVEVSTRKAQARERFAS